MKVIIWGHKLYSHTHSYIHQGYFKGFKSLGYETFWFDDNDNTNSFDFSNCIFFTEGQVDKNIPIRNDCKYITHNCFGDKYKTLNQNNILGIQFLCKDGKKTTTKINDYTYIGNRCLFQPWATNLLPHEINLNDANHFRTRHIFYVGTLNENGMNKNIHYFDDFARAARRQGIDMIVSGGYTGNVLDMNFKTESGKQISEEKHIEKIKTSYLAPALVGEFQINVDYIPCRIFKNISYGQYGVTNSEAVYNLFEGNSTWDKNGYDLFYKAEKEKSKDKTKKAMEIVRDRHTYINRIKQIMEIL